MITSTVLVAEVIGALVTGSLALLVDAAHMLTDAGGLLMALLAAKAMARPPSIRRTWLVADRDPRRRGTGAVLLAVGIYAFIEGAAALRATGDELRRPADLGIIGLAANIASMLVLSAGRGHNLNMRAAFLEVVNDALGSVAVIVSALVIATTG